MGSQHLDRTEAFMRVFAHRDADPLFVRRLANNIVPYSLCSVRLSGESGGNTCSTLGKLLTVQRAACAVHETQYT